MLNDKNDQTEKIEVPNLRERNTGDFLDQMYFYHQTWYKRVINKTYFPFKSSLRDKKQNNTTHWTTITESSRRT